MQPLTIGILSDTHLAQLNPEFEARVEACFNGADMILHAGDLTEPAILAAFGKREIHAVHGNMCSNTCQMLLPRKKTLRLGSFTISLIHRAGFSYDFEDLLRDEFEEVDCIVYGHTHRPVCHERSGTLFINPGSFLSTGRHGHPGTYALLKVDQNGLHATIHEVPLVR